MNNFQLRSEDLFTNPTPRIAVALCLDTSGSMSGEPIKELNRGVQAFYEAVNAHELAKYAADVSIVSFAERARTIQEFMPAADATPPRIDIDAACGGTSLGAGVELSLDVLEQRKQEYKDAGQEYHQPWIVFLSDGQPTDNGHLQVAPRIKGLVEARKLSVFSIGVGGFADMQALAMLSPKRPPIKLKGLNFVDFFEFLGKSVAAVSESQPDDTLHLDITGIEAWAEV